MRALETGLGAGEIPRVAVFPSAPIDTVPTGEGQNLLSPSTRLVRPQGWCDPKAGVTPAGYGNTWAEGSTVLGHGCQLLLQELGSLMLQNW